MRLLQCLQCKTLEPLPDPPRGLDPRNIEPGQDPLLDDLVARHQGPDGAHIGNLMTVEDKDWNDQSAREEILKQLNVSTTGLPGELYALKNTFQEDALKCFKQHGRPEVCIDWHSDKKKLGRPTPEGQAWQKQNFKAPAMFLCDYCPVRSLVDQRKYDAATN